MFKRFREDENAAGLTQDAVETAGGGEAAAEYVPNQVEPEGQINTQEAQPEAIVEGNLDEAIGDHPVAEEGEAA